MNIAAAKKVQNLRGLDPVTKGVAFNMAIHADQYTGIADMGMPLLARESGLSDRKTAVRHVKILRDCGVIEPVGSISRGGFDHVTGKGHTTRYQFVFNLKSNSGVCLTSAEDERNPEDTPKTDDTNGDSAVPPTGTPQTRVSPGIQRVLLSGTPQSLLGGAIPIDGSAAVLGSVEPPSALAVPGTAVSSVNAAVPGAHSNSPTSSSRPGSVVVVVVGGATAFSDLGRTKSQGETQATPESEEDLDAQAVDQAMWCRQAERRMTPSEIVKDFKRSFDRLNQQRIDRDAYAATWHTTSPTIPIGKPGHWIPNPAFSQTVLDNMPQGISLTWKPPSSKHRQLAAYYWKQVGSEVALAAWENFLLLDDHEVTQPRHNEDDSVIGVDTVQQDWLLYLFLKDVTDLEKAP